MTCKNIPITDHLAMEKWGVDSWSQHLYNNFLSLHSPLLHMFWSTVIQIAPDNFQKCHG